MEIIAEIGQNHNGDMTLAKELIDAAKKNGANAAKFQLFDVDSTFSVLYKENPEIKERWYDYHCKTQISMDQVFYLAEECRKVEIEFLASAFDTVRVKWLEGVGVKRHKVASRSIYDEHLIRALEQTQKPLILSLGQWKEESFPEINTKADVDFLYCISNYPTKLQELKFNSIDFNLYSGFSDHTIGINAALVACSRGARILEKHFTLDKKLDGPDHVCSMTPDELSQISKFRDDFLKIL